MVNINYGDQIFGEWEVICRVNKYDIKKYIFNNYEKIYIMLGVCGLNELMVCLVYIGLINEVLLNLYLYIYVGYFRKKIYRDVDFFI